MSLDRDDLLRSLANQRRRLAESIVLTPVDSLPFSLADREHTAFLHGLYLTDKVRTRQASRDAVIQFGGRDQAARDIAAIHRLLADSLGASEGSLRLLSGLHAHTATFMSVSAIGQKVMLLSDEAGGHFNTRAILERLGLQTIAFPIDHERLCIDRAASLSVIERERPDFLFIDRSEGLRYEDFSWVGALRGPTTIFDASQYITPILRRRYENPLSWGFDLMLFSLHKAFPGPQKAAIVGREIGELWGRLVAGLSTLVSSSHAENSYLAGLSLLRTEWLECYVQRSLDTALELERQLARRGVPVFDRANQGLPGWPATHHLWIRSASQDEAFEQFERLTAANLLTNYRKLPYRLGWGLRLGTAFSAVAGIDMSHVDELADIVTAALTGGVALRNRVRELAESASASAILPLEHWSSHGATAVG